MPTASDWNRKYPRGTLVKYYPTGKSSTAKTVDVKTRGSAYHLGSGTAVVPLEGIRGATPLAKVEPVAIPSVASI